MAPGVMLAVLGAALLHAGWNALLRHQARGPDGRAPDARGLVLGAALWALPLLPLLPVPPAAAWPALGVSALVHALYFEAVGRAHHQAAFSQAYPLMRGLAPLLTAALAGPLFGEWPGAGAGLGLALLAGGVLALGRGPAPERLPTRSLLTVLGVAGLVLLYTLLDAHGVRAAGPGLADAAGYSAWLFVLSALPLLPRRAPDGRRAGPGRAGLLAGGCSLLAYGITLAAMTRAPVAQVAALRETSVLFGVLMAAWIFHEPVGPRRWMAAAAVAAGAALLRG